MPDGPSVLTIGESLIELRERADGGLDWTFAGDALNCAAAIAAANPEAVVQHLTGLGDDDRSRDFLRFCESIDVDTRRSPVVPGSHLGLYWITTVDGDRQFQYWRSNSAARLLLSSGTSVVPASPPELIVITGVTLAVSGAAARQLVDDLETATSAGATVAFDTNHRPALWPSIEAARAAMEGAMSTSQIVHASADDIAELWNEDISTFGSRLAAHGVREAVITDGSREVVAFVEGTRYRAEPVAARAVDTSGAGDAFFGTYLGHRLHGNSVESSLNAAVEVCGHVVQTPGALGYLSASPPRPWLR